MGAIGEKGMIILIHPEMPHYILEINNRSILMNQNGEKTETHILAYTAFNVLTQKTKKVISLISCQGKQRK